MANNKGSRKGHRDGLQLRGFFRVHIVEEGDRIVGDSGWCANRITNDGIRNYLMLPLAGGTQVAVNRMMLGTGGEPAAGDTALPGELGHAASGTANRVTVSAISSASSQVEFRATFASSFSFATTTANIANIGLINSVTTGGSIFAGNTFASSLLNTNQDVQASYIVNFQSTT